MKILITSGGTKIPIDRVRSITNMSRGTFGSRIADAFFYKGLEAFKTGDKKNCIEKLTFFMAKDSKMPFVAACLTFDYIININNGNIDSVSESILRKMNQLKKLVDKNQ